MICLCSNSKQCCSVVLNRLVVGESDLNVNVEVVGCMFAKRHRRRAFVALIARREGIISTPNRREREGGRLRLTCSEYFEE